MSMINNLLSSMFGVGLQQQARMGGLAGGGVFRAKYHAYSDAFWNSENRSKLSAGDKIVIPSSALEQLTRLNVSFPIMFRITHDSDVLPKKSHCSVLEFTAEEGSVYLPLWMIDNLGLNPNGQSVVQLETVTLPKGSFVQFQAHETKFAMLSDPRAVLEKSLRSYSALTVGDTIQVEFCGHIYKLDVTDVQPKSPEMARQRIPYAISIIETDIKVDFKEPRDYKKWSEEQKLRKEMGIAGGIGRQSSLGANGVANESKEDEEKTGPGGNEIDEMDWIVDVSKKAAESSEKSSHFDSLKSTGYVMKSPKGSRSSVASTKSKTTTTKTKSYKAFSMQRGAPLGSKRVQTGPKSSSLRGGGTTKSRVVSKEEEIVGSMRYIYEVYENGERKCIRKLPLRANLFQGQGRSLE